MRKPPSALSREPAFYLTEIGPPASKPDWRYLDHSEEVSIGGRGLEDDGRLFIWDVRIFPKSTDKTILFIVPLKILLSGEKIEAGYGIPWNPKGQNLRYFKRLASQTGFKIVDKWSRDEIFYLEVMKPAPSTKSCFAKLQIRSEHWAR